MTLSIRILSDGFRSPNARAMLHPILIHRHALGDAGFRIEIGDASDSGCRNSDILIVDSKFYSGKQRGDPDFICSDICKRHPSCGTLIWFDTTDSAGWLFGDVLPLVKRYWKNQILADRTQYLKPLYGRRFYTDYYYRQFGITDHEEDMFAQVAERELLDKLRIGWNSGLSNYGLFGPLLQRCFELTHLASLLSTPTGFHPPDVERSIVVSCRMGVSYKRASVAYQRMEIRKRLAHMLPTSKLSRRAYFNELKSSRVVISPFGLGEITLKDFEVFINGALLLKPEMHHMETWPDFFQSGITMQTFKLDFSDLEEKIAAVTDNREESLQIATAGQKTYRRHVSGEQAGNLFVEHFQELIRDALG